MSLLPTSIVGVKTPVISVMMVPIFVGCVELLRLSWVSSTPRTAIYGSFPCESTALDASFLTVIWATSVALRILNLLPMQTNVKNIADTGLDIRQSLTICAFVDLMGLTMQF